MVATVLRLKVAILRHTLRRERWRAVLLVLGAVWLVSTVPSVAGGLVLVARQPVEIVTVAFVLAGSLLVLGWAVVPVLLPALDDSLEITRFATLGVPARRLAPALLLSALLGLPTVATALLVLSPAFVWATWGPAPGVVAVLAAPIGLATCLLAARLSTLAVAAFVASRRSQELGAALAALAVVGLALGVVQIGRLGLEGVLERVPGLATVLGWSPLGLAWAAPAAMAEGDAPGAAARLLLGALAVLGGLAAWTGSLARTMVSPASRGGRERRQRDAMLPAGGRRTLRLGARGSVADAVAARAWRSWSTDARYQSALVGAVLAPVAIVLLVATVVDAPAAVALSMGPLMAATIGWGRHNDIAFDGSAFWMHVVAAVPGRADRWGRVAAVLRWSVPVIVVVTLLGAVVAGRPDLAAASMGASFGLLGAGLAVSSVISPLLPYSVPAAGSNPFATEMGSVGASLVAQLVSSAATLLVSLPVLVAFGSALWWDPAMSWVTLALGLVGGAAVLALGVRWGGRIYDDRAVWLLARLR